MKTLTLLLTLGSVVLGFSDSSKLTIVVVHGSSVDGSISAIVIPMLERDGYDSAPV